MLSTTTPFKIHDENAQAQTHLTSAKKRSLATSSNQSGLPLNFSTKTPQKSILSSSAVSVTANKTSRKALVDLSSSQVNIRVPNATPSHTLSLNINKQPTNVIKATPSHVKTTTIATPSTARQSGTVQASSILPQSTRVSESDDDKDDEMICTRMPLNADDDPFDKVVRKAADIKFRVMHTHIPTTEYTEGVDSLCSAASEMPKIFQDSIQVIPEYTLTNNEDYYASAIFSNEPLFDQGEIDSLLE